MFKFHKFLKFSKILKFSRFSNFFTFKDAGVEPSYVKLAVKLVGAVQAAGLHALE